MGPHNYLLMTLNDKLDRSRYEHERVKEASIKTSQGYAET